MKEHDRMQGTLIGVTSYRIHKGEHLKELTERCLRSISQQKCSYPFKAMLVDDSSELEDVSIPEGVDVRRVNYHCISKSWNLICRSAFYGESYDYALILNNDIELLQGSLENLVKYAHENPDIGVIHGCEVLGSDTVEGYMFSAFLISKLAYETTGGFDENFSCYIEDWDYLERLKEKNLTPVMFSGFKVRHERSATKNMAQSEPGYEERHMKDVEYYRSKWGGKGVQLP
jgi:hypothetical protein